MTDDRMITKLYTPPELHRIINDAWQLLSDSNLTHSERLLVWDTLNTVGWMFNLDTKKFYEEMINDD